ncbi:MAG: hypothetical protein ACLFM8_07720 [Halobacteriales archaeon]
MGGIEVETTLADDRFPAVAVAGAVRTELAAADWFGDHSQLAPVASPSASTCACRQA